MTGLGDSLVALIVSSVLSLFIASRIKLGTRAEEGRFLRRVFWWTLALRYALAVGLNVYAARSAFAGMFWGDSGTYDVGGHGIALVWQGDAVGVPSFAEAIGRYGFYYFVAAIYFVFGRNQLLVQFLNGTIGALTVLVMYALATRFFGASVAKRAAILMAFFPGMMFWSAGMYKDPAILHRRVGSTSFTLWSLRRSPGSCFRGAVHCCSGFSHTLSWSELWPRSSPSPCGRKLWKSRAPT